MLSNLWTFFQVNQVPSLISKYLNFVPIKMFVSFQVQALKSQSSVSTNNLSRSDHQLQQQAALYSPSNTSTTLSGVQDFGTTDTSFIGYTGCGGSSTNSELNRTQELERTCASLQSQVNCFCLFFFHSVSYCVMTLLFEFL